MIEFDQPQSMLHFYQQALGTKYLIWLPLTAIIGFVLTLLAVVKWRGSVSVALLILAVPMPIVAGLYGYFDGMLASFQIIAMSTTQPKPSEWAQGEAMALVSVLVGLAFGSFVCNRGDRQLHSLDPRREPDASLETC
jgi:glucose-6-phosphate-specific signal transduction histidine kinase